MTSTAKAGYKDFLEGKLISAVTTTTSTGVTVKVKQINASTPTWTTIAHRLKVVQKTATNNKVEIWDVASGTTQSGQTVTLGTITRGLPLDDGTSFAAGTGIAFAAGADVFLSWDNKDAAQTPKLDIENTFTAANTFSGGVVMSGTTKALRVTQVTTAERDAIASPANGMIVYNTTTGVMNQYIGGAWTTFATGTVGNAADGTRGGVDLATEAEVVAGTATDATSTAPNVIPVSIVKTSSTGAVSGSVPALNTSVALDRTIGGLGTTSGTAYTLLANGTTSTSASQSLAGVGTSGQLLTSNGAAALPTFQTYSPKAVVVMSPVAASTTKGVSTTSEENFTASGYTYAFSGNSLTAGDVLTVHFTADYFLVASAGGTLRLKFGSTTLASVTFTNAAGATRNNLVTGCFSVNIRTTGATGTAYGSGNGIGAETAWTTRLAASQTSSSSIDFTGSLTLQLSAQMTGSDASNGIQLQQVNAVWNKA